MLACSTALLSNARFLPMGFAVAPSMTSSPLRRFLTGATLADASFAIAHVGGGRFDPARIAWAAPVQYAAWVGGTIAGVVGAGAIGEPQRWGLDVLFPVFYLSMLLPVLFPYRDRRGGRYVARVMAGPARRRCDQVTLLPASRCWQQWPPRW